MGFTRDCPQEIKPSFLWITRGKLWINPPNWGKLVLLFELFILRSPPYMGKLVGQLPYSQSLLQRWIRLPGQRRSIPSSIGDSLALRLPCIFAIDRKRPPHIPVRATVGRCPPHIPRPYYGYELSFIDILIWIIKGKNNQKTKVRDPPAGRSNGRSDG